MLKNRVRVLLAKAGQTVEATDIFSDGGLKELLSLSVGELRGKLIQGIRFAGL